MQSVSGSRPRSDAGEGASTSVVTLGLSLSVFFCDFIPSLRPGLSPVPELADRARGAFAFLAGVRAPQLAQLPTRPCRKLRLGLVHRAGVRAAFQFLQR